MITVKKSHEIEVDPKFLDQFSSVVRFAYNRRVKDEISSLSELEKLVKSRMMNIDLLDSSWIKTAVAKASSLKIEDGKKLYFGGKRNFFKRKFHKNNDYDKTVPVFMRGSTLDNNGNRKAELDVIENRQVIFKLRKGVRIEIPLKLSKNEYKNLCKLQILCEQKKGYFNIEVGKHHISLSFDENLISELKNKPIKNRYLGIDLNPNFVGISIQDVNHKSKTIIHEEIVDLRVLLKTGNTEKRHHEVLRVAQYIRDLTQHYKVECVCIEDLDMKSKNHNKGKKYNKLVNNDWNRNLLVNNLTKWLHLYQIRVHKVNAAYSSFIGQLENPETVDSVAAAREIGCRGFLRDNNISEWIHINQKCQLPTRWKEMVTTPFSGSFKELYEFMKKKNLLNSYRVLFRDQDFIGSSSSLWSSKSLLDLVIL